MVGRNRSSDLPPGFRFHPTDEELIMYYLRNQATSRPCPVSIIPEVDIYKFDPWELPEKTEFGENEWYFFTPRDRKYPNGVRPNRAAVSGYWKATGTDKSIYSGTKYVGVKKALVFYTGRPPKGIKTDWIMHEYRLIDSSSRQPTTTRQNGSMRLDDWVLCRIYKKKNLGKNLDVIKAEEQQSGEVYDHHHDQMVMSAAAGAGDENGVVHQFPRPCSLSHLWELEYMGSSISQIFGSENTFSNYSYDNNSNNNNQQSTMMSAANNNNGSNLIIPRQLGEVANNHQHHHHSQYSDAMKFPVFEF